MHPSAATAHSGTGKNYSYDANGNMITRGTQTLTWDVDNRVSSISISGGGTTSMEYDYTGMRVKKTAGGITLYPFKGYEIDPNGVVTKYIRIGNENFASKRGTSKYFYHNDHLGSVNVVTDSNGAQVQLNEYGPWGGVSRSVGSVDPTHRFTGQELDPETGLYYYGGRYYDPEISRFASPDPYVQSPDDPQNLDRYSYVLNNPVNLVDPSGHFWWIIIAAVLDSFLPAAVTEGAIAGITAAMAFQAFAFTVQMGAFAAINVQSRLENRNSALTLGGPSNPALAGASAAPGGGYFSPSLGFVDGGCEVCSDASILANLFLSLFNVTEAAGADFPKGSADPAKGQYLPFTPKTKDSVRQGICTGCGVDTTRTPGPNQSNIGHNIARSRGGDRSSGNALEFCRDCNLDMRTRSGQEHLDYLRQEQQEINRMNTGPAAARSERLQRIFWKRWQWLRRWGTAAGNDDP